MQRGYFFFSSLLLAATLFLPVARTADARNQHDKRDDNDHVRYYDRDHSDFHNWDDHEDRTYRRYLAQQHRGYLKFQRASIKVHRQYWNWRHTHPESD